LAAGRHPIRVAYTHPEAGAANLSLRYAGPGVEEGPIPANALLHDVSR